VNDFYVSACQTFIRHSPHRSVPTLKRLLRIINELTAMRLLDLIKCLGIENARWAWRMYWLR